MSRWYAPHLSTFSIVAQDAETRQFGVAVQTHQMCVGTVVPWAAAGIGAIATQAMANIGFGPLGLSLLREGVPAQRVIEALVASDPNAAQRQIGIVDSSGQAAAWTGDQCIPEAQHQIGAGYTVQANMMTRPTVVAAMAVAYESAQGPLPERLMAALWAAQQEGGDIRGMQSAALRVVSGTVATSTARDEYDLRVDEHSEPLTELDRLVRLSVARKLSAQGFEAMEAGYHTRGRQLWELSRAKAPELEEPRFSQAVWLAEHGEPEEAGQVLRQALSGEAHPELWRELIRRLALKGYIEQAEVAQALIDALSQG